MPKYHRFRDVHHLPWDEVVSRHLGYEGHGGKCNMLFQCPNPACRHKASVSVVKRCGRCFHCPWTFYVHDIPQGVLDALYRTATAHATTGATTKVPLDIRPVTERTYQYLETRGLSSDTIQ